MHKTILDAAYYHHGDVGAMWWCLGVWQTSFVLQDFLEHQRKI